jgi:hypothetical protein
MIAALHHQLVGGWNYSSNAVPIVLRVTTAPPDQADMRPVNHRAGPPLLPMSHRVAHDYLCPSLVQRLIDGSRVRFE